VKYFLQNECPRLPLDIIDRFGAGIEPPGVVEEEGDVQTKQLQKKIALIDLAAAARRLGARFGDNKLTLKVLGKDFSVD